jgi:SAM-dependent methyltransferase
MRILNLGCGVKTSGRPEVINIDWSIYLRMKRNRFSRIIAPLVVRGDRRDRFDSLPTNVMVHNLAKGIPFDSGSIDHVYHSHLLEHLDRDDGTKFLIEVKRVLKPGGIQRIVVPDLEKACRAYILHISTSEQDPEEAKNHDDYVARLIEQSVRREAHGTSQQGQFRRIIEGVIVGDARRRGETHQWMYDRINLKTILVNLGYREVILQDFNASLIPNWHEYGLDITEFGDQYKPESLYMEAIK